MQICPFLVSFLTFFPPWYVGVKRKFEHVLPCFMPPIITSSRYTHKLSTNIMRSETDFRCNAGVQTQVFHSILKIKIWKSHKESNPCLMFIALFSGLGWRCWAICSWLFRTGGEICQCTQRFLVYTTSCAQRHCGVHYVACTQRRGTHTHTHLHTHTYTHITHTHTIKHKHTHIHRNWLESITSIYLHFILPCLLTKLWIDMIPSGSKTKIGRTTFSSFL